MYFTNRNNFFHGIMFHHFHDNKIHLKGQGSISKDEFYKLIKFIGREKILSSEDFLNRFKEKKLKEQDLCFTFDDALGCQHDIALPILEELNIKSFFFVNSSVFTENPDLLEVNRYFRLNYFKNVDEFYDNFFKICEKNLSKYFIENNTKIAEQKKKFPFYSFNDIKFRLVRDNILNKNEYQNLMTKMFKQKNFDPKEFYNILFISKSNLIKIKELGHTIGLHGHTHPTYLEKLSHEDQLSLYLENLNSITNILKCNKKDIVSMSHPCGSYNANTIKILQSLDIEIGFKPVMTLDRNMKKVNNSKYEIARQDHAEIIKIMN